MNEAIKQAHDKWLKAEQGIPKHEYEKGYKSRTANARKLWRKFSDLCKAEGLKPVEVASSFYSKTINI